MKKILFASISALTLLAFSCGTDKPEPKNEPVKTAKKAPFEIIDHKNLAFGGDIPEWVSMDVQELESLPENKDNYVFIFNGIGESLTGAKMVAANLDANSELSKYLVTRTQDLFTGSKVGDQNAVETYFEQITKTLSQSEYKGFRKLKEYWVLRKFGDKKQDYNYMVMFTIPKAEVKRVMEDALEKAPKPDTDEKKRAKDNVKKIIDGELPPPAGN